MNAKESVEREEKLKEVIYGIPVLRGSGQKMGSRTLNQRMRTALWPLCYIAQWLSSESIERWSRFEACIIRMA